jgi:aromatic-L-amino-acid decarboxylase
MELHESGEAAPSLTILDGAPAIRAAILNHRTTEADIDRFMTLLDASLVKARRAPHEAAQRLEPPHGPGRTPMTQD